MEPILIDRSQINDISWNALIARSSQRVIYAFTHYLDLVCYEWKAFVYTCEDEYELVMPIPVRRKFGVEVVYQPLFCQYLGIFSSGDITCELAEKFINALNARYAYISSYHFNPENCAVLSDIDITAEILKWNTELTYQLDLGKGYPTIRKSYSIDRQKNLKRAEKAKWVFRKSNNIHPLIWLFVNHHEKNIDGGVSETAYDMLDALFHRLTQLHCADLWYAARNGRIHAGIFVAKHAGKAVYLFNAADDVGRKENARTFLIDKYLQKYDGEDLLFDFESPPVESIASFYKSFGSKRTPFLKLSKNGLPFPFRQIQNWRKSIRTS